MSFQEFDEIEEMQPNKRNKWWWLLKLVTTILTAIATVFGVQSCALWELKIKNAKLKIIGCALGQLKIIS